MVSVFTFSLLGQLAISPIAAQDGYRIQPAGSDVAKTYLQGLELESILGREIRTNEEDMGRIIDILADRSGQVQAAVVELGGFLGIGSRKIAVEWSALRFETRGQNPIVILEMGREQLRLAPEYRPNEPVIVRKAAQ